ncbi:MAG: carboxymuconolactone decarboxylase family protein [Candidatus Marinimicrobia bacterium]|nr:carboxymuconolactone decarboxylase family protein [Candidatus Neomarinimicrobiota bacterium]
MGRLEEFNRFREHMNEKILAEGNLETKRFFGLDSRVYEDGRLDRRTKEMMGLVASLVLRCDDCIAYHVIECADRGVDRETFYELFNVGLVVGGSITIPHMRRAVDLLDELEA